MPFWDNDDRVARRAGRRGLSRRHALIGAGALGLAVTTGLPHLATGSLRVGAVAALGLDPAGIDAQARRLWGRGAILVPFPSWGSLRDHASAAGRGLIDGAVLPAADGFSDASPLPPLPVVAQAALVVGRSHPATIGIALRHPAADGAIRRLLSDRTVTIVELPPAALLENVAAGLIDGAVLTGLAAADADGCAARLGLACRLLERDPAAGLVPPLALVRT